MPSYSTIASSSETDDQHVRARDPGLLGIKFNQKIIGAYDAKFLGFGLEPPFGRQGVLGLTENYRGLGSAHTEFRGIYR
jgi:hypothetical protein